MAEEDKDKPKMVTQEEFDALKATNQRIVDEANTFKKSSRERLDAFEEKERLEAEKKNDHKSLFEKSDARVKNLEEQLANEKFVSFNKNLALEVAKLAKDAHNPLQVMRALNITELNTDLENGTLTDLATQLDALRKDEQNLFIVGQSKQQVRVPGFLNQEEESKEKPINEMTVSELESALKNTTRK